MRSGWNPTRRNRKIGTSASGRGRNNRLVIPESWRDDRTYYEKLVRPRIVTRVVHGREIAFSVEETRADCVHACTVDDLARVLGFVPAADLTRLSHIVLRQPGRKETTLKPVWGRLAYYAKVGRLEGPAIFIDAQDLTQPWRLPKSETPDETKERERLRQDGHPIRDAGREYVVEATLESVRSTQLYRTLLHEIGHWVDWLESVERPVERGLSFEEEMRERERYDSKPSAEKEAFAHGYADRLRAQLVSQNSIPFERIVAPQTMRLEGLRTSDFLVVDVPEDPHLRPIGAIRSTLTTRREAPKQGREGAPDAWIELFEWAVDGLHLLEVGDEIVVITWLHQADRSVLRVRPRSNPRNPITGVFATRSPDRPNPLGLHPVTIRAIEGNRMLVGPIEAIDQTPIVDIKPVLK